jgi:hypothetical protein
MSTSKARAQIKEMGEAVAELVAKRRVLDIEIEVESFEVLERVWEEINKQGR